MENETDESLMKLVQDGNKNAFSILVKRYLIEAVAYVDRITEINSDDIVQESFIKMWKNSYRYNEEKAKVKTWFYKILTNTCYTFLKKEKNKNTLSLIEDMVVSNDDIEKDLLDKEKKEELKKVIKKLNKREQEIISLKYFKNISNKDTAKVMGITVNATGVLLNRVKKKLKKLWRLNYE